MMFAEVMNADKDRNSYTQVNHKVDVFHAKLSLLHNQTSKDATSGPASPTKCFYLTEDAVTAHHTKSQVPRRDHVISQHAQLKISLPRKVDANYVEEEKFLIETEEYVFYHNAHPAVSSMITEAVLDAQSDKK